MATIRKQPNGRWQAIIRRRGIQDSRTFRTKDLANSWVREIEDAIDLGLYEARAAASETTLNDIIEIYRRDHLPKYTGHAHETQLRLFAESLGDFAIAAITPSVVADWRDDRLRQVSEATTRKDLMKLSRLLNLAAKSGCDLPRGNPVKLIEMPSEPGHRDRRLERGEYRKLLRAALAGRRRKRKDGTRAWPLYAYVMRWAIETGMRQSEIADLRWRDIDFDAQTAAVRSEDPRRHQKKVRAGKINGARRRTKSNLSRIVALSPAAIRLLKRVRQDYPNHRDRVFGFQTGGGIGQAHTRVTARAGLAEEDLLFHDFRHEAASRLARILQAHELAYMLGHTDIGTTMRYYHPHAGDIVGKLKRR